jgi:hypothetical protein
MYIDTVKIMEQRQDQSFRDLVIMGFEQMNSDMQELRRIHTNTDQECREAVAELRVLVARLETKIAIYASLGAIVGSAVMTWMLEQLKH